MTQISHSISWHYNCVQIYFFLLKVLHVRGCKPVCTVCLLGSQVAILHFTFKNAQLIHCTKIQMFLVMLLHILSGFRNIISQDYFTHFLQRGGIERRQM